MGTLSAGQLFKYAQRQALDQVLLKTQGPAAGTVYQAISTSAVTGVLDSNETAMNGTSINEYSTGTAYARQSMAVTAASDATPSKSWNSAILTWGPFSSAPGTANWAIVTDHVSSTTAHPICAYLLGTPRTPATGDSLQAVAGDGSAGKGFIASI